MLASLFLLSLTQQDPASKIPALPPVIGNPSQATTAPAARIASPLPQAGPSVTTPETVAEPNRLAITPGMTGKISADNWDPLYSDGSLVTYMEWEPDKLHLAARVPNGQDVVFSIDTHADGWLAGNDNLEVRLSNNGGHPAARCRLMVNGGAAGPHFVDIPDFERAIVLVGDSDANNWTVECTLNDVGTDLIGSGPRKIGMRVDAVPSDGRFDEIVPRGETILNLVYDRTAGMPTGLAWSPEMTKSRSFTLGSGMRIRHTFRATGEMKVKRIEVSNEGPIKDTSTTNGQPFPDFDRKGRAFVDYDSKVDPSVPMGWYINRAAVTAADGITSLVETSFRVAPLLDFDIVKERLAVQHKSHVQKFTYYLHSNTDNRLDGVVHVNPPAGWRPISGEGKSFIIYNSRGTVRRNFELEIPADASGVFPIKMSADIGGRMVDQTIWISIVPTGR